MLTSSGTPVEAARPEVLQAAEVGPPGVREVLVEGDLAGVVRARHHPGAALAQQPEADLAAQLVIDVAADAEREVDLLRLEPGDLAAEQVERGVVVGARSAEELLVALVAAEDGVGQVQEDDRRLGEVGEALVLDPSARHQVAGGRSVHHLVGEDRALGRQVVHDRLVGDGAVADARPAVPRRALPEPLGGGVGVGLGGVELGLVGGPRWDLGGRRVVGQDGAPVEGLGRGPDAPWTRIRAPRAGTRSAGPWRRRRRRP